MELAHADHDQILAAFLEQGDLPDIAKRLNMSLASLVRWAAEHAQLLADLHQLLTTRCTLLAAQLESAALSNLASISTASTTADDAALRERALERQRRAAAAILRHASCLQRTPRPTPARADGVPPTPLPPSPIAARDRRAFTNPLRDTEPARSFMPSAPIAYSPFPIAYSRLSSRPRWECPPVQSGSPR